MTFEKILQQGLIWRGFQFSAVIFLNIVLSRYLQAAGAGWVYFLTNFFALAVLIGSMNIDSAFAYFSASKNITASALSWFGIAFTVVVCALLVPAFKIYFTYYPVAHVPSGLAIKYGEYYAIGIVLSNLFAGLFYSQKNFFLPGFTLGLINYLLSFYIIYLHNIHVPSNNIVDAYFIGFSAQGIVIAILFFIKNKVFSNFQMLTIVQLKHLFRYSAISFTANFIYFLVCRIDYWFVEHYRNSSELGNYIQASKMGQMLLLLPQILASVILPQIAEGINKEFVTRNIIVMSRLLIQLFVVLILLDMLFGQLLFTSVFGNSFYIMNLPFLLLLPGILAVSILTLFSAYFAGKNKVKVDVIGASIALAFVIICNFSFTNKYGIIAAAIISSVGYSINLGYSAFIFFRTETEYSVKDFLQWKAADYSLIKEILKKN